MDKMHEKYLKIALKLLLICGILTSIYLVINYMLPFFAPFVAAILIALINEPCIELLEKKFRIRRKYGAVLSLLLTLSLLGTLATLGVIKIYNELVVLQKNVYTYVNSVSEDITGYLDQAASYYHALPKEVTDSVESGLKDIAPRVESLVKQTAGYLISTISSIPKVTVFIIVALLSAYFISSDRKVIRDFIYRQMPDSWSKNFSGIKSDTFAALFGYLKALLILVSITFIEVTVGLFILRVDYAILMGLVVALSDLVPIVGTGIVMVPWILWNLISGNPQMALGLTIIYLLGIIIRQILEPKIVGDQIGLHPLVTLAAMYIGLEIFGFLGLLIGPISIIIIKSLQSSGVVTLWKE